ncbi:BON domain-containing protein [Cupriavidus sp. D39]|uniref:BON domain-containing protein n=1 Tax=Cupriavidus sp. D39 TaxID=2997877 RepID=UPI00226F9E39|nr:BON domain-containing protein [Cupriavidus sp. D39]MCY0854156.1 BON domain-containing protein [Cupriavidus sp. D39]
MNSPPGTPGRPDSDSVPPAAELATKLSDNAITMKVKAELLAAKGLRPSGLRVKTENGVVHLDGKVQSDTEKLTALNAVRAEEGVQSVVDGLQWRSATAAHVGTVGDCPWRASFDHQNAINRQDSYPQP